MTIVLDDYNRIFKAVPHEITHNLSTIFDHYRTFDLEHYRQVQHVFKQELASLGEYEVVVYTTGSEAIQYAAIWSLHSQKHHKIVKFENVYHGSFLLHHEEGLLPLSQPIQHLHFSENEEDVLKQLQGLTQAVVLLEPTFSDYFAIFSRDFYNAFYTCLRDQENLLILDEIRSGFFRLGTFSFAQQLQLSPDIVCFGKGLALGLPLSVACFKKEKFSHVNFREVENYRTSQSLNSLSLALALRLLRYFKTPSFLKMYQESQQLISAYFSKLKDLQGVKLMTVQGSCVNLKFSQEEVSLSKLVRFFRDLHRNGIQCRFPEKHSLLLVFPFDTNEDDVNQVCTVLQKLL